MFVELRPPRRAPVECLAGERRDGAGLVRPDAYIARQAVAVPADPGVSQPARSAGLAPARTVPDL